MPLGVYVQIFRGCLFFQVKMSTILYSRNRLLLIVLISDID